MQFVDEICNSKFFIFNFWKKKDYAFMKFHFYLTYKIFLFFIFS